jgi:HD-GYP domain-containing protein (c-di-GMP phosphodiesterase class II)
VALHVGGPYIGARDVVLLQTHGPGTDLALYARIPTEREPGAEQFIKRAFEQGAQGHLRAVKVAAEARVRAMAQQDESAIRLVQGLGTLSMEQLLQAVDEQEIAEFGHSGHGRGVARVAASLAAEVGLMPRHLDALQQAARLHDVGKVGLPRALWAAPRTLSDDERRQLAEHVRVGVALAARAGLPAPVLATMLHHHERWDGTGYPDQLAGEAIPLRARILAIAESVDTMLRVSYRREAMPTDAIINSLEADRGRRWDPMLARAVSRILRGKRPDWVPGEAPGATVSCCRCPLSPD